jgi:hypothetical protein
MPSPMVLTCISAATLDPHHKPQSPASFDLDQSRQPYIPTDPCQLQGLTGLLRCQRVILKSSVLKN